MVPSPSSLPVMRAKNVFKGITSYEKVCSYLLYEFQEVLSIGLTIRDFPSPVRRRIFCEFNTVTSNLDF